MNEVIERRRTIASPTTVDRESREFEAVIATEATVGGIILRLAGLAIADNVPLLLDHRAEASATVGRMIEHRAESGQLIGRFRLSSDPTLLWLVYRLADGTLSGLSVGFRVDAWGGSEAGSRVATRATLLEVSITPTPADANTRVRTMDPTTEPAAQNVPETIINRAEANREIRALATTFDLGPAFSDELIDRGASVEEALAAVRRSLRDQPAAPVARITAVHHIDGPEQFVTRAGEAVFARANPRHEVSEAARPFVSMTNLDLARHCLQLRGESAAGAAHDVITRALHTTSDFPQIFGNAIGRQARRAYELAPDALKTVARQTTARDFRAKTSIQLSEAPVLERVNESGEFTHGTLSEAKESYSIATYGKIIALSRPAIVNDDLGAFADLAARLGQGAAETEARLKIGLLEANAGGGPTMEDGNALFHANHGNLAGSGATISEGTLSAARLAMRTQVGLSGHPVNVRPRYLLVPPALETTAEKEIAQIQPSASSDVNPFAGRLELLVDARLSSATRWYLIADPAQIDGLEYAYLEGEEGPQTSTRAGFEVDGVEIKVRLDFGAAFLDWRGWYANPGA
ncbi:prohead protease/major capsid protein fusion protein [Acuticoccus mangrovi]|uniref:Mu-like prophage major head subunit gpT family protein n=1 Tax=Acuticoccus mangrovi TaxID=2796142 RepID=A0A934MEG3_9HYPH|nr:prohead protease/major capsid protein fusion protein [Acuticoccus mangrovi]MBJ3774343.1 Mu-like prophage major head subunit gpT family protein [Acuticoccus mangrovi]